jgi:hypothetical protein
MPTPRHADPAHEQVGWHPASTNATTAMTRPAFIQREYQ